MKLSQVVHVHQLIIKARLTCKVRKLKLGDLISQSRWRVASCWQNARDYGVSIALTLPYVSKFALISLPFSSICPDASLPLFTSLAMCGGAG